MSRWLSSALLCVAAVLFPVASSSLSAQTLTASPNPIPVVSGSAFGKTTISWNAPGYSSTQIRIGSPSGPLFASGGSTGQATTGLWVVTGTTFYLLDASSGNTLATFRANTVSAPGVAINGDGVIEIFSVGADNAVYENSQTSAGSSTWSGWISLGGIVTTTPTVGVNADGSLVIFAVGSDNATLFYNSQAVHNGAWSGWIPLYGVGTALSPSVATNTDGTMEIFALGSDGAAWHNRQTSPGGAWSGWYSLQGGIASTPIVGRNADGRLEIFVLASDGATPFTQWQNYAGSGDWSGWVQLSGILATTPSTGINADGRLMIFALGSDNATPFVNWQSTVGGGDWVGWNMLGGYITSSPSVAANSDGRLEIFAIGSDGLTPYTNWQTTPSGGWSGWYSLGGGIVSAPSVAVNTDGRMEIFGVGSDSATVFHNWQTSAGGAWSGWVSLDIPQSGQSTDGSGATSDPGAPYPNYLSSTPPPGPGAPDCGSLSGNWADNNGHTWMLIQNGNLINGTTNSGPVTWQVTGSGGGGQYTLSATNPQPSQVGGLTAYDATVFLTLSSCNAGPASQIYIDPTGQAFQSTGTNSEPGPNILMSRPAAPTYTLTSSSQITIPNATNNAQFVPLSTGDTLQVTTTASNSNFPVGVTYASSLFSNPNNSSNCNASLSIGDGNGTGSATSSMTASPSGCGGMFSVAGAVGGTTTNALTVVVPPLAIIQMLVTEAGGQPPSGDNVTEMAIGAVLRHRLGDTAWFSSSGTTYQQAIAVGGFDGYNKCQAAHNCVQTGNNPETKVAASIYAGVNTPDTDIGGSGCYFSPDNVDWINLIKPAITSHTTTMPPGIHSVPKCYGDHKQLVWKFSVGANVNNDRRKGAPAIILVRYRELTDPAVVQID